ncbi:MAG TPA: hypothetical protein VMP41_10010 [Acidimicrobiales bacterium]|nr:hypothetical protein [Acidimicrobiales bacterium]
MRPFRGSRRAPGSEYRYGKIVSGRLERDLDEKADAYLVGFDVDEVGQNPDTFIEFHEDGRNGIGECRMSGVVEKRVAIDATRPGHLGPSQFKGVTEGAHRARRMVIGLAVCALLDHQPSFGGGAPEALVVVRQDGSWSHSLSSASSV